MTFPRIVPAGLLLAGIVLSATACGPTANPQGWAAPTFEDGILYYFPDKDRLAAVDFAGERASTEWIFPNDARASEKDLDLTAVYGDPVIDGGRVYLGSYKGELLAVSVTDGSLVWRQTSITGSIVEGPTLADGVLYFGTTEGKVYAVTAATGKFAPGWEKPLSFGDGVWAPPVVAAGTLYIATMDGELHALGAADRREKWARPFKTEGAIPSLTLLDAGHLFVPTLAKKVFIVETATGEAPSGEFRASDWVWTRPAFAQGVAYFADLSGTIYALDITSGRVKWTTSAGGKVKSGPAIVDDVLVLVDREPVVHFLTLDGALRNTVPILGAGTVRADVTAGEAGGPFAGKALIATTKGKLFEADPRGSVVEIPVAGAP